MLHKTSKTDKNGHENSQVLLEKKSRLSENGADVVHVITRKCFSSTL